VLPRFGKIASFDAHQSHLVSCAGVVRLEPQGTLEEPCGLTRVAELTVRHTGTEYGGDEGGPPREGL